MSQMTILFKILLVLLPMFVQTAAAAEPAKAASAQDQPIASQQRLYLSLEKIEFIKANRNKYPYFKFWNAVKEKASKSVTDLRPQLQTAMVKATFGCLAMACILALVNLVRSKDGCYASHICKSLKLI